jgi:signal transduction histidine kinase
LSPAVRTELFRIAEEALNNASKHAGATSILVRLREWDGCLELSVADDGRGFDPTVAQGGVGLVGMRERVEELGGVIEISSRPAEGTEVTVRVPVAGGTPTPVDL